MYTPSPRIRQGPSEYRISKVCQNSCSSIRSHDASDDIRLEISCPPQSSFTVYICTLPRRQYQGAKRLWNLRKAGRGINEYYQVAIPTEFISEPIH